MKKVLVLTAALFLMSSISHAAILEAWLQFVTAGSTGDGQGYTDTWNKKITLPGTAPTAANVGQLYTIEEWCEIVPDPAIPGEDVSNDTLYTMAFTIVDSGLTIVTEPNNLGNDPYHSTNTSNASTADVKMLEQNLAQSAPGARQVCPAGKYYTPTVYPGGLGSIESSVGLVDGSYDAAGLTCLVMAQNWLLESWNPAQLYLSIAPSSNYFDGNGDQVNFSQIETGTMVDGVFIPGTELTVGPTPEPATLALLGFGAVATFLRRRNKK